MTVASTSSAAIIATGESVLVPILPSSPFLSILLILRAENRMCQLQQGAGGQECNQVHYFSSKTLQMRLIASSNSGDSCSLLESSRLIQGNLSSASFNLLTKNPCQSRPQFWTQIYRPAQQWRKIDTPIHVTLLLSSVNDFQYWLNFSAPHYHTHTSKSLTLPASKSLPLPAAFPDYRRCFALHCPQQ